MVIIKKIYTAKFHSKLLHQFPLILFWLEKGFRVRVRVRVRVKARVRVRCNEHIRGFFLTVHYTKRGNCFVRTCFMPHGNLVNIRQRLIEKLYSAKSRTMWIVFFWNIFHIIRNITTNITMETRLVMEFVCYWL